MGQTNARALSTLPEVIMYFNPVKILEK